MVTEYYSPTLKGATERFRRYAPGLRKRDVNLRVMTVQRGDTPLVEVIDAVLVRRFPVDNDRLAPSAALLGKTLQHIRGSGEWPQVLQLISHTLGGVPDVWRFRLNGVPALNTITMMPTLPQSPLRRVKRVLHQWLRYSPFNLLVTSSTVVTRCMMEQGVSSRRLVTIPNGVDTKRFHATESTGEKRALRLEMDLHPEDKIILFVGFISYRKGVDLLIEAWSQVIARQPRARLILVGLPEKQKQPNNEESFYRKILIKVEQTSHPERIHFVGEVDNVEVYMRAADLLVLPSRLEGMPNVVLEAMASGLPCVLTPFVGLPEEFGKPGREYLLANYDPYSLTENIVYILDNKDMNHKIALAAREWVMNNLDVEISLDKYANLYKAIAYSRHRKV